MDDPTRPTPRPADAPAPFIIRVPMIPVALAMVLGTLVGSAAMGLGATPFLIVAIASLAVALAALTRRRFHPIARGATFVLIATLTGWHGYQQFATIPVHSIARFTDTDSSLATVRGRIVSVPAQSQPTSNLPGYQPPPRTTFVLDVSAIKTTEGSRTVTGHLRVTVDAPPEALLAGERVELAGWLSRFATASNPGEFDWPRYAHAIGLDGALSVPSIDAVTPLDEIHPVGALRRGLWRIRSAARAPFAEADDGFGGDLLTALIFGNRSARLDPLRESMVHVGLAQFLSISGLHLGILLGFVYLLCRLAMLSSRRSAAIVLVVLAGYLLLAEPRPALLRSGIMAATLALATMLGRRVSTLNALGVACTVLLAINPGQLFLPGFQLSFGIVAGIILLQRPVQRRLFRRFLKLRGLMVFRHDQAWRRWAHFTLANWLMGGIAMSLAAYVVALPLAWLHFGLITPYAPLLALVLTPVLTVTLIAGYLAMVLSPITPSLGAGLAQLAGLAGRGMTQLVHWASTLPGVLIEVRPVGWTWVGLYAATLASLAWTHSKARRWLVAILLLTALIATTVVSLRPAGPDGAAHLYLLAVGNGQCAVLRLPSGPTVLFDAGTQSGFDVAENTLLPFLAIRKLPTPHIAFASHANTDHYNALIPLARRGLLRRVYLNATFGEGSNFPGDRDAKRFVELLRATDVEIVRLHAGDEVQLDDDTRVTVLWPPKTVTTRTDPNNRSLVLRVDTLGRRVLLPGDLQAKGIEALTPQADAIDTDVLILPHHGAWMEALPAFIDTANPQVVLQSTGRRTRTTGFAGDRNAFFDALRRDRRLHVTGEVGCVELRWTPQTFTVSPEHSRSAPADD